uniref:Caspase family p20 domain-containing protein n=1 Tax=Heliothis virescens TaxID=7102 RepID=A0A2A4KAV9_HELVI
MQSDSRIQGIDVENIIGNSDVMNIDMMSEIEKELQDNPYDMISLVFLLYEVPDTALQRLIVFQRVSNDAACSINLNMLHEWLRHAKHDPNWKHQFVEALLICQLYNIVRKLGFHVQTARKYYQTDNIAVKMYVNPMKKALYKLCESINSDNLLKLKKALLTYDLDTTEYESCELVFLKLMCEKFIIINQYQYNSKVLGFKVNVDKLIKIVENLPGLKKLALEINMLQHSMSDELTPRTIVVTSTPSEHMKVDESKQEKVDKNYYNMDFDDVFEMLGELKLDEMTQESLKSDRKQLDNDSYEIKSNKRVGICVIINQENFYPSKQSIEITHGQTQLDKRIGSDKDKMVLEKTMKSLNFAVISATDIGHKAMLEFIMDVVKNKVSAEDSIFMLCILSHGVRGQVYAADSVKVKMDDIQNMLDSDEAVNIHNMPKLLIVQACQVDEATHPVLVADSPKDYCNLKKTNFLIYYATAPDLEAYRNEKKGSIFIQILCRTIRKFANVEHVFDIFTKVTDNVTLLCTKVGCAQVPIFQSTLRKKLYLQIPQ